MISNPTDVSTIETSLVSINTTQSDGTQVTNVLQEVIPDTNNSSTSNLDASGTFTGTASSTLGVVGIQVSLKTDQNCIIHIDQSPDGTNWDLTDEFNYYTGINNFGVTVQAINSYVRVRVTNSSSVSATTFFRLQTVLCPVVDAIPRSLDSNGLFRVSSTIKDLQNSKEVSIAPTRSLSTITPVRLVGTAFGNAKDTNFWTETVTGSGSVLVSSGVSYLSTGTTADSTVKYYTNRKARYVPSSFNQFRGIARFTTSGTENNTRRIGAYDDNNGFFFELSGTTFSIVTRNSTVDTTVSSGSFNGRYGLSYLIDTNNHRFSIDYANLSAQFYIDDMLIHTVSSTTTPIVGNLTLPATVENINSGGLTSDIAFDILVATIVRLGELSTERSSYYQSGTTAGVVLKYGAGDLHELIISGVANNSVITLYDNTAASGTTIWSSGAMSAQTQPFCIDFKGLPFSTGLTLVISAANSNVTVVYE